MIAQTEAIHEFDRSSGGTCTARRLIVVESFTAVRDTTNPYQVQLVQALERHTQIRMFAWRRALAGRFDVLHLHWPEVLVRDRTAVRTWARRVLLLLVLIRIRIGRAALVRTIHNVAPHETGPRTERMLLSLCDRWTTLWITLNSFTPIPNSAPAILIPHGHYRDWFSGHVLPMPERGRLAYVGRIRRYKGVDDLIAAFGGVSDAALRLRLVGQPETASRDAIVAAAHRDPRISAELRYLSDTELAAEVGSAELVVLPYREMHNSGAALLALSLGRPILVPANDVNRALAREAGSGWVSLYEAPLAAQHLSDAISTLRTDPPPGDPELDGREWGAIACAHVAAFKRATVLARRGRGGWRSRRLDKRIVALASNVDA